MEFDFEDLVGGAVVEFEDAGFQLVLDVVGDVEFEAGGHGGGQQEGEGKAVLAPGDASPEISQHDLGVVGLLGIAVDDSGLPVVVLGPHDAFFAFDAEVEEAVGAVFVAVDVDCSFDHLAGVVHAVFEGEVDSDFGVAVEG